MSFERIIVVDDDSTIRRMLVTHLQKLDVPVVGVGTGQQAREEFQRQHADLFVLDLRLPDTTGIELMEEFIAKGNSADVIMMTGFGTIETAVEAMKMGAANYLLKPFTTAQFDVAVEQVLRQRKLRQENKYLKEQLIGDESDGSVFFESPQMKEVEELIKRVAPTDATVLINGESGVGKEVVARSIYLNSTRADKPFIKVNCAAVPENLLESEFFGHEKGAFTGATSRRQGRFELANGGTLLLDEVTEISMALQAKLLRVLQEQEFERVGGNRTINVDVRILATSNRDLEQAVVDGKFRQDLYFRLNVLPVNVPSLRQRAGEVEFLLDRFIEFFARKHNKPIPVLSALALEQLCNYPWPGNVRELKNYTERAVILSDPGRELEMSDFVLTTKQETSSSPLMGENGFPTIAEMERKLIELALKKTKGHRNQAAEILGINVRTLRNKLNEYAEKDRLQDEPEEQEPSLSTN